MALIKCRECGKKISNKASACPGCGAPVDQKADASKKKSGCGTGCALAILAFIVLAVIGTIMSSVEETKTRKPNQEIQAHKRPQELREDDTKGEQLIERLKTLEEQLLDPITSARAALRLEAIGKSGIEALKVGILSTDPEVRFRSAEALAYLDDPSAAPPLK